MEGAAPLLLQDRTTSAPVSHLVLSPRMNLLALVLDHTSVAIFRLSWQRLATIPLSMAPGQHISSLIWSPDGAHLLVATSAADLSILSVDRSAFASSARAKRVARETGGAVATVTLPVPAACLGWVGGPRTTRDVYEDRAGMLAARDEVMRAKGLIFCGDRDGFLTILSQNLSLLIARVRVLPEGYTVVGLHVNVEVSQCIVYGQRVKDTGGPRTRARGGDAHCVVRAVGLETVLEHLPEIERIGREMVALKAFMERVQAAATRIEESWLQGAAEVRKATVFEPMDKVLTDFAEPRSRNPWEMLHYVFCGGTVDGAVLQFLAADMSENGAKEALRAFRGHVDDLSDALHDVLPVAENSVVRACEYQALSKLRSRFSSVGLKEHEARELFELTESLYWALGEIMWEIEGMANETEAFLAWLVIAATRAGGNTSRGRTAPEMANLTGEDGRLVSKFFQRATSQSASIAGPSALDPVEESFKIRLLPAVENHRRFCEKMLARPVLESCSSWPADEGIFFSVPVRSGAACPKFRDVRNADEGNAYEGTVTSIVSGAGNLISVFYDAEKRKWSISHAGFLREKRLIHDAAAYANARVAFLVREASVDLPSNSDESKAKCELWIHSETDQDRRVSLDSHSKDRNSLLPEVSELRTEKVESLEAGHVEGTTSPTLSIDPSGGIAR